MEDTGDTARERAQVERWVQLAAMKKQIFGWPDWQLSSPRQRKAGEVATHADQFFLSVLLCNESGASIEGLELRIVVWRDRPNEDATALLQTEDDGWLAICRLDCWPPSPHENKDWRRLGCAPHIEDSHVHLCVDNAKLGRKAFKPHQNLPVAVPVNETPHSWRDMMGLVEYYFNVDGAAQLPPPDWQGRLFK